MVWVISTNITSTRGGRESSSGPSEVTVTRRERSLLCSNILGDWICYPHWEQLIVLTKMIDHFLIPVSKKPGPLPQFTKNGEDRIILNKIFILLSDHLFSLSQTRPKKRSSTGLFKSNFPSSAWNKTHSPCQAVRIPDLTTIIGTKSPPNQQTCTITSLLI